MTGPLAVGVAVPPAPLRAALAAVVPGGVVVGAAARAAAALGAAAAAAAAAPLAGAVPVPFARPGAAA